MSNKCDFGGFSASWLKFCHIIHTYDMDAWRKGMWNKGKGLFTNYIIGIGGGSVKILYMIMGGERG